MRVSRSVHDPAMMMGERARAVLGPLRNRMIAVATGTLAIAYALSLATWSATDPSLSYATDVAPRNLLGYPGAVTADLAIQLFGLAAIAPVLAVLALAVAQWRNRPVTRTLVRAAMTIAATFLLASALAALPVFGTWPLPTGLGGALGDLLLGLPVMLFFGMAGQASVVLSGLVFGLGGLGALFYGAALSPAMLRYEGTTAHRFAKPDAGHGTEWDDDNHDDRFADDIAEDGDNPDGHPDGRPDGRVVALGFVMHWWLSARAALARLLQGARGKLSSGLFKDDDLTAVDLDDRREPMLDGYDVVGDTGPVEAVHYDPPMNHDARASGPAETVARVHGMRTRLEEGKRARREAQPSLLPSDEHELPPLTLLAKPPRDAGAGFDMDALEQNARVLESVLDDFGVKGEIINVRPGPVVTLYELEPAPGTKSSRVINLAEDIARSMSAVSARVAVVPGRNVIGIELPNAKRETVFLRELLASKDYEQTKQKLPLCLGKTIGGEPVIADLARMPHLLIAGTTGSGKSVAVNTMILSLLYRLPPERCKLIMIDPKMLELSVYDGIPHLLSPVVTDPRKAVVALKWTVREMEERYRKMSKLGVRNIDGFNSRVKAAADKDETLTRQVQTGFCPDTGEPVFEQLEMDLTPMPYIVVIVDEMADLMMVAGKDIEGAVQRLAQMARAAGIHLITATQRPSVDVITGTIKANFPTRISFQVTSKIDSRTILGEQGAEHLLGQGDMLYMMGGGRIQRVHGPFVADGEVEAIVAHLQAQGAPDYKDEITEETDDPSADPGAMAVSASGDGNDLYDQAVAVVLRDKKASTSYVQRRLSIGYNRAATLIERMEQEGVISRPNGKGQREILVGDGEAA